MCIYIVYINTVCKSYTNTINVVIFILIVCSIKLNMYTKQFKRDLCERITWDVIWERNFMRTNQFDERERKRILRKLKYSRQNVIKWENLIDWNLLSFRFVLRTLSRLVFSYQIASFSFIKLLRFFSRKPLSQNNFSNNPLAKIFLKLLCIRIQLSTASD